MHDRDNEQPSTKANQRLDHATRAAGLLASNQHFVQEQKACPANSRPRTTSIATAETVQTLRWTHRSGRLITNAIPARDVSWRSRFSSVVQAMKVRNADRPNVRPRALVKTVRPALDDR